MPYFRAMLHYYGSMEAFRLGEQARAYIPLYEIKGQSMCLVPFKDLLAERIRYVKFILVDNITGWVFVDLVDA